MTYQIKRIVVTGTVGAGKTTLIRTVSDIETVNTDRSATDKTKSIKPKTTVGMDFGRFQTKNNLILHIYGTPGQSRFNFMWDLLISKADAYILLIPANRPQELYRVEELMNFINKRVQIPMIFGITHTDCLGALNEAKIANSIGYGHRKDKPPFVVVDPHKLISIKNLLETLVKESGLAEKKVPPIQQKKKYSNISSNLNRKTKRKTNLYSVKF
ncbi:MAG: 50S ribosome-binding GTPase [Prochloraceae cyanobacterium]|nr:50S ribosome-binding GTPase [Prochloraceae cyanobacterium]